MWFLLPLGRSDEALTEIRRALEPDPLDPFYDALLGCLLALTRQFEPAIRQLQHAIGLDPTCFFSYWFLSVACHYSGPFDQAVAAAEKATELSGRNAMTLGSLGRVYCRAGRAAEGRQLLNELTARRASTYVPASALAFVHAGLGELDACLDWIATAVEERDPVTVTALKTSPAYDRLRSDSRFQSLLRTLNLES
jgi:hypothetical protein